MIFSTMNGISVIVPDDSIAKIMVFTTDGGPWCEDHIIAISCNDGSVIEGSVELNRNEVGIFLKLLGIDPDSLDWLANRADKAEAVLWSRGLMSET